MRVDILGGGTTMPVRPHLALCSPAYGTLARKISSHYENATLHLTRMADPTQTGLVTNQDVERVVRGLIRDPNTHIVYMTCAMTDFVGEVSDSETLRLSSSKNHRMDLRPAPKVLDLIRAERKDIFLVACKTTAGVSEDEMFVRGLRLLKRASANLVLVNDLVTRINMIVTPEQARYCVTKDRDRVIEELVRMTNLRSQNHFTRTTVVEGDPFPYQQIPQSLRTVLDFCLERGAYKDVAGIDQTVGHFAFRDGDSIVTSRRKSNFNRLPTEGMLRATQDPSDPSHLIVQGGKPSVGGASQRIILTEHPDVDYIVHFHAPLRDGIVDIPIATQFPYECGSHECGANTSRNLKEVIPGIKAVMLDQHGPNIVFGKDADPQAVIGLIERSFDLSKHTGEVW